MTNTHPTGADDKDTNSISRRKCLSSMFAAGGFLASPVIGTANAGWFTPDIEITDFEIFDGMVERGGDLEIGFEVTNHDDEEHTVWGFVRAYPDDYFRVYEAEPAGDGVWGAPVYVEGGESERYTYDFSLGYYWPRTTYSAELTIRENQEDGYFDTVAEHKFGFAYGTDYSYSCRQAVENFEGAINDKGESGSYFLFARDNVAENCDFED